jgi:hypothetical protein
MRGHGKEMMHDKAMRSFGAVISGLVCGAFVACAGGDAPPVDDALGAAISQNYANGAVAGGAGGAGPAGAVATPAEPLARGNGGSSPRPPAANNPTATAGTGGSTAADEAPAAADAPAPTAGGACDGFAVLNQHCNGGSCHGDGGLGNFAASEEDALAYVGVSGTVSCSGEGPLLDPENPRQSVIIQKVLGTASCGAPMPLGTGGPLTDDDISCLEEWIGTL